jgi:hypothetical protein
MNQIERAFAKLRGEACWDVYSGTGTFLTLQFGEPHLVIREPAVPPKDASARTRRVLQQRRVYAQGDWHPWITYCDWTVRVGGRVVGDSSSYRRKHSAARALNGQKLLAVHTNDRGARTRFAFDLGAELETKPYNRTDDQWVLFGPGGSTLVWRADRMVGVTRGSGPRNKYRWRRLAR